MTTTLLLAMVISIVANPLEWVSCPSGAKLLYRTSGKGIGYVSKSEVVILDGSGQIEKKLAIDPNDEPLYVDDEQGLVMAPRWILKNQPITENQSKRHQNLYLRPFSQNGGVFIEGLGVTYYGESTLPLLLAEYDGWSAVGINKQGTTVAQLRTLSISSALYTFRSVGKDWLAESRILSPYIENVANCSVLPGFNDIVFLDDLTIAYIGVLVGPINQPKYEEWLQTNADLKAWPLDIRKEKPTPCFLFVTRLKDGYTKGYATLQYSDMGESRGPRENNIVMSSDGRYLYIRTGNRILKLVSDEMLKRVGFK